jgi:hypothetical protein
MYYVYTSVGDPDLGLPDPDPLARGTDPDPSLFSKRLLSGLIYCLQNKIVTQNFIKKLNFLD